MRKVPIDKMLIYVLKFDLLFSEVYGDFFYVY